MMMRGCRIVVVLAILLSAPFLTQGAGPSPAKQYFDLMDQGLAVSRSQIPAITALAEEAAQVLIDGATIYVTEKEDALRRELIGRAGGFLFINALDEKIEETPREGDMVILGRSDRLTENDHDLIERWRARGVYTVAFAPAANTARKEALPDAIMAPGGAAGLTVTDGGEQKLCPVDTALSIVNMWLWTGELTAACTRLGKMPVLYQSYGMPGGKDRAKKYQGQTFHDDAEFTIAPIAAGTLAGAYLDALSVPLDAFRAKELKKLEKAARWWSETNDEDRALLLTDGHMFPQHFQDPRAPEKCVMESAWGGFEAVKPLLEAADFVFYCGYQRGRAELVDFAVDKGHKLAYLTVLPTEPAEPGENVLHLNPQWALPDACVPVPGYDVPILPLSGVVDAAIYWALLAEVCEMGDAVEPASPQLR